MTGGVPDGEPATAGSRLACSRLSGSANGTMVEPCHTISSAPMRHIEVIDHRYPGRFMSREYVTMREVQRDGQTVMAETPVGRMLIKSAPGRVVQNGDRYQIEGMAWGPNPISTVEVKIDNGPWQKAKLDGSKAPFTWQNLDIGLEANIG